MTYPIQTRKHSVHSPIICEYCRKEITKGQRYMNRKGRERHEACGVVKNKI